MASILETIAAGQAAGHHVVAVIVEHVDGLPRRTQIVSGGATYLDLLATADAAAIELGKQAAGASPALAEILRAISDLIQAEINESIGQIAALILTEADQILAEGGPDAHLDH